MAGLIAGKESHRAASIARTHVIGAALLALLLGWAGMALAQTAEAPEQEQVVAQETDDTVEVKCLLPAEIDRYGTQLTIVGARRTIETSHAECVERGGEVIEEGGESPSEAAEAAP